MIRVLFSSCLFLFVLLGSHAFLLRAAALARSGAGSLFDELRYVNKISSPTVCATMTAHAGQPSVNDSSSSASHWSPTVRSCCRRDEAKMGELHQSVQTCRVKDHLIWHFCCNVCFLNAQVVRNRSGWRKKIARNYLGSLRPGFSFHSKPPTFHGHLDRRCSQSGRVFFALRASGTHNIISADENG